jgi:O-antigen/teichoic acid export membrane protein
MTKQFNRNPKRIAKNTFFLYVRMLLAMLVSLYTSRVILSALGVVDWGIFNVIAGLTSMFAFFQSSLSNATQRFLNIEIEKNNVDKSQNIFKISLLIYFCLSVCVIIIGEIAGLWVLDMLNIPPDRSYAAKWVFQATILSVFFAMNSVVFQAVLIARENMKMYAYIGLIDVFGRLFIALIISHYGSDKLILYSILFASYSLCLLVSYALCCKWQKYEECQFQFFWDKKVFLKMFKFSTWNGFEAAVYVVNVQGINILLNLFFGPIVNAARGVSTQVESAINNFTSNFYTAVRPQIIKSYAMADYDYFIKLVFLSSRYAFYLILILSIPIQLRLDEILSLWLKYPPLYSNSFIHWILIYSAINVLTNPFWTAIQAIGKLNKYCLLGGAVFMSVLPLGYFFLAKGSGPVIVFQALVIVRLIYTIVTIRIVREYVTFSILEYFQIVVIPILLTSIVSCTICYFINIIIPQGILFLFMASFLFIIITTLTICTLGISGKERAMIYSKVIGVCKR